MITSVKLGELIRDRREELGISQRKLSKDTCLSRGTVNNIECGKNGTINNILDIMHYLRMDIDIEKGEVREWKI